MPALRALGPENVKETGVSGWVSPAAPNPTSDGSVAEDLGKQLDAAVLDAGETEGRTHLVLRAQCAE
jgi:hypothetical protein